MLCSVLSSIIYLPDANQNAGPSWVQLNEQLEIAAKTYPVLSKRLASLRVRDGESSFDLACFSSDDAIYIVARGTEELWRDAILNDIPILFTSEASPPRLLASFEDAKRWKSQHLEVEGDDSGKTKKRVVCSGHSLGGSVALALVSGGISRHAHVFNFGRGILEAFAHANFAFAHHYRDVLHHHMHGDVISPEWLTFVPTVTYEPEHHLEAHSITNWTSFVERGTWPPLAGGAASRLVAKCRATAAGWTRAIVGIVHLVATKVSSLVFSHSTPLVNSS